MNKLRIKNFKAFRNELDTIEFNGKNLLLYGDNGSGKSSLFEAIRIVFFKDKFDELIPSVSTPEEQTQLTNDFWSEYKNNNSKASEFEIVLNNRSYKNFDKSSYQTYMISIDNLLIQKDNISLIQLFDRFDFTITDINDFCISNWESIETSVNKTLKEFHEEQTIIKIDNEDNFKIVVEDKKRNILNKEKLSNYFNEAKLNLIVLLILFESIKLLISEEKKKVLVLDDFITSLDIANRTFIVRYILREFKDFQILLFTHNVHFYNLIKYTISEEEGTKWLFANLYEINHKHKMYFNKGIKTVNQIKEELNNTSNINEIGNKIRQKSEVLVYELSKLLMIGALDESISIFDNILNDKPLYYKRVSPKKVLDISDLMGLIVDEINSSRSTQLKTKLLSLINDYKNEDYKNIKFTFQELKLFKKVILHPMSHGNQGLTSFSLKEITESLNILQKLELNIKSLIDKNIDGA